MLISMRRSGGSAELFDRWSQKASPADRCPRDIGLCFTVNRLRFVSRHGRRCDAPEPMPRLIDYRIDHGNERDRHCQDYRASIRVDRPLFDQRFDSWWNLLKESTPWLKVNIVWYFALVFSMIILGFAAFVCIFHAFRIRLICTGNLKNDSSEKIPWGLGASYEFVKE